MCHSLKEEVRIITKMSNKPDRVQKSLYINSQLNKALKFMAVGENKSENEIVIEALNSFIPKKYFDMAQK